ncbi:MAG: urea ABC transporter ATP-binding subunit UrtE [Deltaproteobacteria bacterium]|jgi:urea transport system ATP-binding protein|nr:urea ABC transporter ATP-binding subunit UrtE [Deltaproteobacteria bacterium]
MLSVEGLVQCYGESNILRGATFRAGEGRRLCLMGRNGVGKTTLMKCLMGLLPVRRGRVLFKGRDVTSLAPERRARLGIGYVPQGRQIFPLLTVEENLKTGLAACKGRAKGIPEPVYFYFPVLKEMLRRRGGDLSGGQQQQLAVARALVADPGLLILDEPTEGVQPNVVDEIVEILRRLSAETGVTVVHVEQKVPVARKAGDDYAIMERGAVVDSGEMAGLSEEKIRSFLSV